MLLPPDCEALMCESAGAITMGLHQRRRKHYMTMSIGGDLSVRDVRHWTTLHDQIFVAYRARRSDADRLMLVIDLRGIGQLIGWIDTVRSVTETLNAMRKEYEELLEVTVIFFENPLLRNAVELLLRTGHKPSRPVRLVLGIPSTGDTLNAYWSSGRESRISPDETVTLIN